MTNKTKKMPSGADKDLYELMSKITMDSASDFLDKQATDKFIEDAKKYKLIKKDRSNQKSKPIKKAKGGLVKKPKKKSIDGVARKGKTKAKHR